MCPLFWYVGEGKAVGVVRLMIMVVCCVSTAAVYRVGLAHRYHRFMRKKLPLAGEMLVVLMCIAIGKETLTYAENWGGVVRLMLLSTAVFGWWEMAKPVHGFYLCLFFWTGPAVTARRRIYGSEFVYLGWPLLTLVMMIFFNFFIHHHDSEFRLPWP